MSQNIEKCSGCDATAVPVSGGFCPVCTTLIHCIENQPELLDKLRCITAARQEQPSKEKEQDLPDVLNAVRYRTCDRDNNTWYVSVSELAHSPVEIFASTAFDNDRHLQSRISNLTTITRLISLILRNVFMGEKLTLEKTLTQLHRSSRQKNDLPEMLSKVLANYLPKDNANNAEPNHQ